MVVLKKKLTQRETERAMLAKELEELSRQLEYLETGFNEINDSDLLDAAIFQRSALLSRHSYLIKELKRLEREKITLPKNY